MVGETRSGVTVPTGWEAWTYAGPLLSRTEGKARTGQAAGCIAIAAEGADTFPLFCQRFAVRAGERYRARIWARTESVSSSWGPQLHFEFLDAAGPAMLESSGTIELPAGTSTQGNLPAQSFALLTEGE